MLNVTVLFWPISPVKALQALASNRSIQSASKSKQHAALIGSGSGPNHLSRKCRPFFEAGCRFPVSFPFISFKTNRILSSLCSTSSNISKANYSKIGVNQERALKSTDNESCTQQPYNDQDNTYTHCQPGHWHRTRVVCYSVCCSQNLSQCSVLLVITVAANFITHITQGRSIAVQLKQMTYK